MGEPSTEPRGESSHSREELTADLIHAVRAEGLTPAKMGSTGQWRIIINALLRSGWTPPDHLAALEAHRAAVLPAAPGPAAADTPGDEG